PGRPVIQPRFSAWENLLSVVFRKPKLLGQPLDRLGKGVVLAVSGQLQQWKHHSLEIRDSHVERLIALRWGNQVSTLRPGQYTGMAVDAAGKTSVYSINLHPRIGAESLSLRKVCEAHHP